MNKDEKYIITINRELGSGGRTIGRKLAEKLGVEFYDKALIKALEDKFNLTFEEIEKLKGRNHSWWEDFKRIARIGEGWGAGSGLQYYQVDPESMPDMLTTAEIFKAETDILQGIAEEESCVIVGRCAFDIFRHHPNALKIFIHSPEEKRIKRIVDKYGVSSADAKLMIVDNDYTRELYTKTYTGTEWYDARNYDVTLDVSAFGLNGSVDYLMALVGDE